MQTIQLMAGQTYQTPSAKDAFRLRDGSMDVFLVPQKNGIFQRPLFLCHVKSGTTIPGVLLTDDSYVTWRLQIEAAEDCILQIIENASTAPLQRKFIARAQLPAEEGLSFEQVLIEHYMSDVITEDVFIFKSEQARQEDRRRSIAALRQAAASRRQEKKTRVERHGTGIWQRSRQILRATERKALLQMLLLTVVTAAAGILLISLAEKNFPAGMPGSRGMVAGLLLCLAAYLILRGVLQHRISVTADQIAEAWQKIRYETIFCRGGDRGSLQERRATAAEVMVSFEETSHSLSEWYGMVTSLLLSLFCWIGFILQSGVSKEMLLAALLIGILTCIGGGLLYGSRKAAKEVFRKAGAVREGAESDLRQFLGNMEKIRLSGAMEHVMRRYYTQVADGKSMERSAWIKTMRGRAWFLTLIGAGMCMFAVITIRENHLAPEQIAMIAAGGALVILEGLYGFGCLVDFSMRPESTVCLPEEDAAAVNETDAAGIGAEERSAAATLLALQHGSFAYEHTPVLTDITLSLLPGEYLGIAGASGCGKSTLLRILSGAVPPDEGSLYYRGKELAADDRSRIRRHAGIVLQDDQLLNGSIRENILAGTDGVDQRTFWKAAELALLTDDAASMPMGYETLISEQAETISAGQKQKILLARALVRAPEILFLDEAESDLDDLSQQMIHENIRKHVPAGIIVSHHFRSLEKCDRILVLDQGRIVEEGTPEELIRKREKFFELMKRQL